MRHVDTLSTIYRHIFHSKLPTKSSFVEKKRSKVGPILSRKFQIIYKIIVCGEKMVKIGTTLSRKSSKDPSWLAMCNVYFRNELPTGLPAHLMPFSIRVTSCRCELAVIFTCCLCIDIAMSNQHVELFREYFDNRYFWQSITALITVNWNFHLILSPTGLLSPKSYVDMPAKPQNFDFLCTNF